MGRTAVFRPALGTLRPQRYSSSKLISGSGLVRKLFQKSRRSWAATILFSNPGGRLVRDRERPQRALVVGVVQSAAVPRRHPGLAGDAIDTHAHVTGLRGSAIDQATSWLPAAG
jgi:hypothetical protein